jgi:DNA-directed RNA polymerase specialized sigma24 family protein
MSPEGSVSGWLGQLKDGDSDAAQQLWQRYFARLVGLARRHLEGTPRQAADEEDVALSAFTSFCVGVRQGRFPWLDDRDDLWRLLVTLTARKAAHQRRYNDQLKRRPPGQDGDAAADLEEIVGREPTPAFAAEVADEFRHLLDLLGDADLEQLALLKMEGHTNAEMADRVGCYKRTIDRKLEIIRKTWQQELPSS